MPALAGSRTAPPLEVMRVMKGSVATAAATWPDCSAAAIDGKGSSVNLMSAGSTPELRSALRTLRWGIWPSASTAIVLPTRSAGAEMAPFFKTINATAALAGSLSVSYTHLRAHETDSYLVCRLLLEKKK